VRVLRGMVEDDRKLLGGDPRALSRANKRFHRLIHLASHNRFLVQQLDLVNRSMALMATTSFAAEGRDEVALDEHEAIVAALEQQDGEAAYQALKAHISKAFETRLRVEAGELKLRTVLARAKALRDRPDAWPGYPLGTRVLTPTTYYLTDLQERFEDPS